MFRPDPTLTHVAAPRERVVALIESVNRPLVSIPGKPAQEVAACLCGIRNGNETFSVYVGFHLPATGENVVYAREPREFPVEAYRESEGEGVQFVESMGFILTNLNFRNLAADAQERTMQRVPLFHPPATPSPGTAAPEALARLLASF